MTTNRIAPITRYPRNASMPTRVPTDQVTGSSKANGDIRQTSRSARANASESCSSTGAFGRRRPVHHSTPKVATRAYGEGDAKADGDRDDVEVGEHRCRHQDPGQQQQPADDDPGHHVEPRPIHPGAQHFPVIAQQQQEYGGARQEQSGQRLHTGGDQTQGAPGISTIAAAMHDHNGVGQVERFRVGEAAMQRVLEPEHIPERVAARQGYRRRPDYGGVEQARSRTPTRGPSCVGRAGARARRRRRNFRGYGWRVQPSRRSSSTRHAPITTTKAPRWCRLARSR